MGKWVYKKQPHVVESLLKQLAQNMTSLFENGVVLKNGETFYCALVGIKGDMEFHSKYWSLLRSYANIGNNNNLKFCHRCFAGADGYPGEDFSERPVWLETVDAARPWNPDSPPPLAQIPYDVTCPERALQGDLFHIFKTGLGRDIVGGVIVTLMRKGFWDFEGSSKNLPDRFQRAHSSFVLWCAAEKHHPGLRSFSKSYFNMKGLMSAPWTSSKGSDTMLLLRFCCFFLRLNLSNPQVLGFQDLLEDMLEVCEAAVNLTMVHSHGVWLSRECATRLYFEMMVVLRGYSVLGRRSIQMGIRAFLQKPKHHGLHHLAIQLKDSLESGCQLILSPQVFMCEGNEDYVGRVSRLGRRVGFRLMDLRVIQRICMKMFALLKRRETAKGKPAKPGFKSVYRLKFRRRAK